MHAKAKKNLADCIRNEDAKFEMIKIDLPTKMLRFLIEAVDFRIAASKAEMTSGRLDENALSDVSNDTSLLSSLNAYLKQRDAEEANSGPPPGDARTRARLRLIMECLQTEGFSEAEQDMLIKIGCAASQDPAWTDYLYWPDRYGLDGSVDAALDKAMAYNPSVMGTP
jgi:hypothetical protein